jgi:hypothetical protein
VNFVPFVGIAPRRFQHLFDAPKRKTDDGAVVEFRPELAAPRLRDSDAPELALPELTYLIRETVVRHQIAEFLKNSDLTLNEMNEEASNE